MERHCENAKVIAAFSKQHPKVEKVHYPWFRKPQRTCYCKGTNERFWRYGFVSIKGNKMEDAFKFVSNTKLFSLAES